MMPPPHPAFLQMSVLALTLTSLSTTANSRYELRHLLLPFERAQEACHPHGLASFAGPEELPRILSLIAGSPYTGSLTFWVGLKKAKNQCVVPSLSLKGFKWTDGGEDATDAHWAHEPEQTCTSVLCAGLLTQLDGSTVSRWGLVPLSCKTSNHFICNLESHHGGLAEPELGTTEPAGPQSVQPAGPKTAEPEFPRPEPAGPNLSEQKPEVPTPEPAGPKTAEPVLPRPGPAGPKLSDQKPEVPTPEPDGPKTAEPGFPRPEPAGPKLSEQKPEVPDLPTPEPAGPESTLSGRDEAGSDASTESESGSCPHPVVAGARFLTLDPDNSSRVQVDCWSKVRLDLHCRDLAAGWRLAGGGPANLSSVCSPCGTGFRKDPAVGDCVDVDECVGPHGCPRRCLNTPGSFVCMCGEDETECEPTESEAPGPFSGELVAALAGAAAVLVVLALVAGVMIWCCLRRRNKKKKMEEEEAEQRDKLAT
ncbi:C-type lectin domain family 14 member A [Festucalex cinctus]